MGAFAKQGDDGVLEQAVAIANGGDLAAAVGAEQRDTGEDLAEGEQVAVVVAVEQRATAEAGKHQREIRWFFRVDRGKQRLPMSCSALNGGGWPSARFVDRQRFGQGQRAVGVGREDGDGGVPGWHATTIWCSGGSVRTRLASALEAVEDSEAANLAQIVPATAFPLAETRRRGPANRQSGMDSGQRQLGPGLAGQPSVRPGHGIGIEQSGTFGRRLPVVGQG